MEIFVDRGDKIGLLRKADHRVYVPVSAQEKFNQFREAADEVARTSRGLPDHARPILLGRGFNYKPAVIVFDNIFSKTNFTEVPADSADGALFTSMGQDNLPNHVVNPYLEVTAIYQGLGYASITQSALHVYSPDDYLERILDEGLDIVDTWIPLVPQLTQTTPPHSQQGSL